VQKLCFDPYHVLMPEDQREVPATPMAPLMVQLLYDSRPDIDFKQLTTKVEEYAGPSDPKTWPSAKADRAQYFMLEAVVHFKEGNLPSQLCLNHTDGLPKPEFLEKALQQTWDWDEARGVVASAKHVLLANDLLGAGLAPKVRNKQFRGFIRAIQTVVPCRAMHWMNTQLIVNPARFIFEQDEPQARPLYGSINVRLFNIQGTAGDCLMDTMGLAVLGLPDIQCHFRQHSPTDDAGVLYDVAWYLFEQGDIIKNGETVRGILESDHWRCQHEMAMVGPERMVLDLTPGDHYAAGTRREGVNLMVKP
jgi:hypothetical protein